jgi:hypothetical protein
LQLGQLSDTWGASGTTSGRGGGNPAQRVNPEDGHHADRQVTVHVPEDRQGSSGRGSVASTSDVAPV